MSLIARVCASNICSMAIDGTCSVFLLCTANAVMRCSGCRSNELEGGEIYDSLARREVYEGVPRDIPAKQGRGEELALELLGVDKVDIATSGTASNETVAGR